MDVTIDLAKEIVDKFVKNTKREVSIDYIQKVVSEYFQMDVETLQSKKENIYYKHANWPCILQKFTKASLASIGTQMGNAITLPFYTRVKPLIIFPLQTNNSVNTLTTSTRN